MTGVQTCALPISHLDGKHVVIGRVIDGMSVVSMIESVLVDPKSNKPFAKVTISDCGELVFIPFKKKEPATVTPADSVVASSTPAKKQQQQQQQKVEEKEDHHDEKKSKPKKRTRHSSKSSSSSSLSSSSSSAGSSGDERVEKKRMKSELAEVTDEAKQKQPQPPPPHFLERGGVDMGETIPRRESLKCIVGGRKFKGRGAVKYAPEPLQMSSSVHFHGNRGGGEAGHDEEGDFQRRERDEEGDVEITPAPKERRGPASVVITPFEPIEDDDQYMP